MIAGQYVAGQWWQVWCRVCSRYGVVCGGVCVAGMVSCVVASVVWQVWCGVCVAGMVASVVWSRVYI